MRILFTFAGGSGHLEPLIPIARAAKAAGHVVASAGRPWMTPVVEALGFPAFPTGSDADLTPTRRPLVKVNMEREILLPMPEQAKLLPTHAASGGV
jgi:UDP:flavonoid glycosyltransferase YjiC (YdhE family)